MTAIEFSYHVVQLREKLTAFAQTLTSNRDDAEDLFQETVYKALKYRAQYTNETNLRAWLYTIMKNTFINAYRKKNKAREYQDFSKFSLETNKSVVQSDSESVTYKEIWNAVNNLEETLRIPFIKHYEGYKYKDIAKELNLPIGTVKSRIFNARKILGEQLSEFQYA